MATPDAASPAAAAGHRRNKSSSMLKSIIIPRSHKRAPSDVTALSNHQQVKPPYISTLDFQSPLLPLDHSDSQLHPANQAKTSPTELASPRKSQDASMSPRKSFQQKTLSSVSLRTMANKEGKPKEKQSSNVRRSRKDDAIEEKPKKTKSSTNLASMFGRSRSRDRKQSPVKEPRDKENTTPPASPSTHSPSRPPIWAEFSSQQEIKITSKIPLNDQRRSLEEEMALYTPQNYSPSKQRNFFDYGQPSLQSRSAVKERPKSMFVPKTTSTTSLLDPFTRKKSSDRVPLSDTKGNEGRADESAFHSGKLGRPTLGRASTDVSRKDVDVFSVSQPVSPVKKQNRVMAAVAAFNGKSKQGDVTPTSPTKLDPYVVDTEFEEVLVSSQAS